MKNYQDILDLFKIPLHSIFKVILCTFSVIWFMPFREGIISMDDMSVIAYYSNDTIDFFQKVFLNIGANRYRPVFYFFQYLEYDLFGKIYQLWFYFNILVNILIIIALYNLILKITKSRWIPSAICLIYITCRFSYYNIVQLNGILEAICLLLLILIINYSIDFWQKKSLKYLIYVILLYSLIIFTHERYVVLIGFLVAIIFLSDFITFKQKIIYSVLSSSPLLLNIILKLFIFKIPFLVGTGSSTELGFNFNTAVTQYIMSVVNVIGINIGPGYLYGLTFDSPGMTLQYKIVSLIVTVIPLLIITAFVYLHIICNKNSISKTDEIKKLFLTILLIGLIILSFSVTIRVEQRWIYAPFIVYITYIGYCACKMISPNPATLNKGENKCQISNNSDLKSNSFDTVKTIIVFITIGLLVCSSITMDLEYKQNINGIFFMGAMQGAKPILDATYGQYGTSLENYEVYVIDPNPGADWSTSLNALISANSDLKNIRVNTVSDILKVPTNQSSILVYTTIGQFSEVSLKDAINFPQNLKKAQLLSGQYELNGGLYISRNVSAILNTGKTGLLKGKLTIPDAVRLPNGITIFVDNKEVYSQKYDAVGEYSFQVNCEPNKNVVVTIAMDKVIIPYDLGLGVDRRSLSVILNDFYFE
jgi:hypothetical protein